MISQLFQCVCVCVLEVRVIRLFFLLPFGKRLERRRERGLEEGGGRMTYICYVLQRTHLIWQICSFFHLFHFTLNSSSLYEFPEMLPFTVSPRQIEWCGMRQFSSVVRKRSHYPYDRYQRTNQIWLIFIESSPGLIGMIASLLTNRIKNRRNIRCVWVFLT